MSKRRSHRLHKATAAQMMQRVAQVRQWQAWDYDRPTILRKASEAWGVSERTVDDLMARARAETQASINRQADQVVADMILWYRHWYTRACEQDDGRLALQAAAQLAKLLGLNRIEGETGNTADVPASDKTANILRDVYKPE